MAKPIKIEIVGDSSGFSRAIGQANKDMGGLTKTAKRVGANIGKSLAVVGTAAAVVGVKSVASAVDFEKSMNEVFTLLPGISGGAMDEMNDQVLEFSKEFGTLPDEVVPALYSALSAGVPKDNVFEYLETANKLAVGGVTDVETAVDGLSSVVNAYGDEAITAAEASDIIFTTVKLGKTTVDEIASSISNVTPIASALGVGFDEVGSGLAVLTSMGVPTAQATTQLRSAFAELGKEGSVADRSFRDLTGISFTEFLANGGDLIEGLSIMDQGAQDAGGSVIDMFGSVEAGSAVLALTAEDGAAFNDALGEMDESAGATETAFETMAGGMSFQFDRIKAAVSVFMIEVGTKLMPVVEKVVAYVQDSVIPAIESFAKTVQEDIIPAIQELWKEYVVPLSKKLLDLAKRVIPVLKKAFDKVVKVFEFLSENLEILIPLAAALAVVILTSMVTSFIAWATAAWAVAAPLIAIYAPIVAVVAAVALIGAALIYAYQNFESFRNVVDGVVDFFMETVLPTLLVVFRTIKKIISTYIKIWIRIIKTFVTIVKALWDRFGGTIIKIFKELWKNVKQVLNGAIKTLKGIFDLIKAVLTGKWREAWRAVKRIMSGVLDQILGTLRGLWTLIKGALSLVKSAIVGVFNKAWDAAKTAVSKGWDKVAEFFSGVPDKIKLYAYRFLSAGKNLGTKIMDGLRNGLSAVGGFIGDIAGKIKGAVIGSLNTVIGIMNRGIPDKLGWGRLSIDLPDNPIPTIPRAMGGPASGGVLVGERGPELVHLPNGSNVVANHEMGGGGIVVNVQSNADPHQIASEVAWAIRMGGR